MASRSDRKQREQAERKLARAIARVDALELLELTSRAGVTVEPVVPARTLAQDVSASMRRKDASRLRQLAHAYAKHPPELGALDRDEAMACRWALLGGCLGHRELLTPARALADELRPFLLERAPTLAAWIDAALAHDGHVPPAEAAQLPALAGPAAPPTPWTPPDRIETVEAFRDAVLAGSVLLRPRALADLVTRHLQRLAPEARAEHAAAARPAIRLRMLEAASAGEHELFRVLLELVATLHVHHPDVDALASALRLARSLDASQSGEDLRGMGRLLEAAWREPDTRPMVEAVFGALEPIRKLHVTIMDIAERLLAVAPSAAVWGRAFELWREHGQPGGVPPWLERAHAALVESGELARWLGQLDERHRHELVDDFDAFSPELFLDLVEQLWDQVSAFDHSWLAQMTVQSLTVPEVPDPDMLPEPAPMSIAQLRRKLERAVVGLHEDAPQMLLDLVDELSDMPPRMRAPPPLVAMAEVLSGMAGDSVVLSSRQQAFLARAGLRMVPCSFELLHVALHAPEIQRDGMRWIDAHLGASPSNEGLLRVAVMLWDHEWAELAGLMERRIEARASRSIADLVGLVCLLDEVSGGSRALLERLSLQVLQAHERGEPGIDRRALVIARRHAPKAAKKAGSKKAGSKKAGSKKAGSKKTGSKKTKR